MSTADYFGLLAAIYIAPRVSTGFGIVMAGLCTVVQLSSIYIKATGGAA